MGISGGNRYLFSQALRLPSHREDVAEMTSGAKNRKNVFWRSTMSYHLWKRL